MTKNDPMSGKVRLKDLKNDGVFEKKEEKCAADFIYNKHLAKLSEVEARVDEEYIFNRLFYSVNDCCIKEGNDTTEHYERCKKQAKALSSSIGEWLELRKTNKGE